MPNAIGTSAIGPTFGEELASAGLGGLAMSWGEDGSFHFSDAVTDEQRSAVEAVYAAHDPRAAIAPTIVSRWQFAQQAAIQDLCTEDQALAWAASGTAIPPKIAALVTELPAASQFPVKIKLCANTIDRTDPMTIELTTQFGWSDKDRAAFWSAAITH